MSFLDEIATFKATFKANHKYNTKLAVPGITALDHAEKKLLHPRFMCHTLVVEAHCSECFMQMALSELTEENANRK